MECGWEEVTNEDEEWEVPTEFVEGYNPVPMSLLDSFFRTTVEVTVSFVLVKNYSVPVNDKSLTVTYTEANTRQLLALVSGIWKQAAIKFVLQRYSEYEVKRPRLLDPEEPYSSYERMLSPYERIDKNAKINVFLVPYVSQQVLGTTVMWGPMGVGRQSYIILSENNPFDLRQEPIEYLAQTTAHEFGHALGLEHHPSPTHLMYERSVNDRTVHVISSEEARYARAFAKAMKTPAQVEAENPRPRNRSGEHDVEEWMADRPNLRYYINYGSSRNVPPCRYITYAYPRCQRNFPPGYFPPGYPYP